MAGFNDNVASRKPLGRRNKPRLWDNKPKVLKDKIIDGKGEEEKESQISPMRKIINVAKEINKLENEFDELAAEEYVQTDLDGPAETAIKSDDKGKEKGSREALKKQKADRDIIYKEEDTAENKKTVKDDKPISDTKQAESFRVREYLHNFDNSMTEMKQKLLLSRNDLDVVGREINAYDEFIESEEARSIKLYELYNFLRGQTEDTLAGSQGSDILQTETKSIKEHIKKMEEEYEAITSELKELDDHLLKAQEELKKRQRELQKLELQQRSREDLREIEKREYMMIMEDNKRVEDSIFLLKMEYKKEKQHNNTLKARADQLKQTLNDLKDIMDMNISRD